MPEDEPRLDLRNLRVKPKDTVWSVFVVILNILLFLSIMGITWAIVTWSRG